MHVYIVCNTDRQTDRQTNNIVIHNFQLSYPHANIQNTTKGSTVVVVGRGAHPVVGNVII